MPSLVDLISRATMEVVILFYKERFDWLAKKTVVLLRLPHLLLQKTTKYEKILPPTLSLSNHYPNSGDNPGTCGFRHFP